MQSARTDFKFLNFNFKDCLVLVPGWATDYRIFEGLKLNFNYIICSNLNFSSFEKDLSDFLDSLKIRKATLLGFSLGAFLAAQFAARYPQRLRRLDLVGSRPHYRKEELLEIAQSLKKNKKAWLSKFYRNCFSPKQQEEYLALRPLLKDYSENFNLDELINGLDYLGLAAFDTEGLKKVENIRIFHGNFDLIAPFAEAQDLSCRLKAGFVSFEAGHFLFLDRDFNKKYGQ